MVPSSFTQSEINEFEDPAIIQRLNTQRTDYYRTYFAFTRHMCTYFVQMDAPFRDRLWACSYSGFEWGYTMVITRTVTENRLLIPLMDFRNFISTDSVME